MNEKKLNIWMGSLLIVYTVFLVWVILFKLDFSLAALETVRSVNLVPFVGSGAFHRAEMMDNLLVFIPFGLLLAMTAKPRCWAVKLFCVPAFSFCLEVLQYILAVGRSDVTDLITNSAGGFLGIFAYLLLAKLVKNKKTLRLILTVLLTIAVVIVLGGIGFVLAVN